MVEAASLVSVKLTPMSTSSEGQLGFCVRTSSITLRCRDVYLNEELEELRRLQSDGRCLVGRTRSKRSGKAGVLADSEHLDTSRSRRSK